MALPNLGGKNQPFVDIIFASAPGSGFPNSSPEVGQRKWAKGVGLGNNPALQSGNVWLGRCCSWRSWQRCRPRMGSRVPELCPTSARLPRAQAPARCGRMGNAATQRCTRPGNEQQEQHRVGMRGEFTRGQSPSPFIFGRFG